MKNFQILPHTADIRLKIFGKTIEELFKNALLGMAQILAKSPKSEFKILSQRPGCCQRLRRKKIKFKIKVKSPDINALLVDFLSEVLYQSQINHTVFREVKFSKFSNTELEAEISGNKIEQFDEDIKAVTYHELEIRKTPDDEFETVVIFDV